MLNLEEFGETEFAAKFAGCSPDDVMYIWNKIKGNVIKAPYETEIHALNKMLMWLDKLKNNISWKALSRYYHVSDDTAKKYVRHVLLGIVETYKKSTIISFPTELGMQTMVEINKIKGAPMPNCCLSMDGKHCMCKGARRNRMSKKLNHHKPCFNALFLAERTLNTIVAFNLDESSTKHDISVLRESHWFQNIEELAHGWCIMADKECDIGLSSLFFI